MASGAAATHRIAELALGALKTIGLRATPRNYELWYAHCEGRNPSLSSDIQKAIDGFGKISQPDADLLYKDHIQHLGISEDVINLVTRFQAEVSGLYEMIELTSENTQGHNEILSEFSTQLHQSADEYPAIGTLLEGVINVAKDMRTQNKNLELRLETSASEIASLQRNVENIQAEAMKDALTGIANRATFDKSLQKQLNEAAVSDKPLALVLADIDHFKNFNDTWGHQTGDQVLRLVAEVMDANVKGQDLLARYGGEEFAIILPGTTMENAHMLADRIRRAVEARRLKKRRTNEDLGTITMSMGVALFREYDTMETIIERADQCLYAAKGAGRNQVLNEDDMKTISESKNAGAA